MQKTAHMASSVKQEDRQIASGSLFDLRPHPRELGKSYISLACAPSVDDDLDQYAHQAQVGFENTYRMEPPKRFVAERVQSIMPQLLESRSKMFVAERVQFEMTQLLESHLADANYDPIECSALSKTISQEIKTKVKEMEFDRFKLVCIVNIGEKRDQDVRVGSRCLWDANRDNFASAFYDNQHIFSSATVYAIYFE